MLLAIPFGLASGIAVGVLGAGGSVLAVPVLVYVLGQSVPEATTASLLVVAAGALAGGLGHARAGRVCWRHTGSFTVVAVPGLVAGPLAGEFVSASALLAAFAVVMLAAAAATWRRADAAIPPTPPIPPKSPTASGRPVAPALRCDWPATSSPACSSASSPASSASAAAS